MIGGKWRSEFPHNTLRTLSADDLVTVECIVQP